jgi:predicted nucleotidyltransferase
MSVSAFPADLLAPPDDATVDQALQRFAHAVRRAYGDRVKGIYLFGSRARGDHTLESDADVVVILAGGEGKRWPEIKRLSDIAYDVLLDTGADIQGWPVWETEWNAPDTHENPALIKAMHRDRREIERVT